MGGNESTYIYGVGAKLDTKSIQQVKKDFKNNLDALKKLAKGYEKVLKINPDADISELFNEVKKLKSITDGIDGSENSFADFVDKGTLQRIAALETGLQRIADTSDQAELNIYKLKDMLLSVTNAFKQAGKIKFEGLYEHLFNNTKDQTENIKTTKRTISQIDSIIGESIKLSKKITELPKAENKLNNLAIDSLMNRLNVMKKNLESQDAINPTWLKGIADEYVETIKTLGSLANTLTNKRLLDLGLTHDWLSEQLDDFTNILIDKQDVMHKNLALYQSMQDEYVSTKSIAARSTKTSNSSTGPSHGVIGTGQIEVTPKAKESEWVEKINTIIGNIQDDIKPVYLKPTFLRKSKGKNGSVEKEISGSLANINHKIDVDLKLTSNLEKFNKQVNRIDVSLKNAKERLERNGNFKVKFEYEDGGKFKEVVYPILDKLKNIESTFNVKNGKKFIEDIDKLKAKSEELKNIPAVVKFENKKEILSEADKLAEDIKKKFINITVGINPSINTQPSVQPTQNNVLGNNNVANPNLTNQSIDVTINNIDSLANHAQEAANKVEAIEHAISSLEKNGIDAPEFLQLGLYDNKLKYIEGSAEQVKRTYETYNKLYNKIQSPKENYDSTDKGYQQYQQDRQDLKTFEDALRDILESQIDVATKKLAIANKKLEQINFNSTPTPKDAVKDATKNTTENKKTSDIKKEDGKKDSDNQFRTSYADILKRKSQLERDKTALLNERNGWMSANNTKFVKNKETKGMIEAWFNAAYSDDATPELKAKAKEIPSKMEEIRQELLGQVEAELIDVNEKLKKTEKKLNKETVKELQEKQSKKDIQEEQDKIPIISATELAEEKKKQEELNKTLKERKDALKDLQDNKTKSKYVSKYGIFDKKTNSFDENNPENKQLQDEYLRIKKNRDSGRPINAKREKELTSKLSGMLKSQKAQIPKMIEATEKELESVNRIVDAYENVDKKNLERLDKAKTAQEKLKKSGWEALSSTGLGDRNNRLAELDGIDNIDDAVKKYDELKKKQAELKDANKIDTDEYKSTTSEFEKVKKTLSSIYKDQKTYTDTQVAGYEQLIQNELNLAQKKQQVFNQEKASSNASQKSSADEIIPVLEEQAALEQKITEETRQQAENKQQATKHAEQTTTQKPLKNETKALEDAVVVFDKLEERKTQVESEISQLKSDWLDLRSEKGQDSDTFYKYGQWDSKKKQFKYNSDEVKQLKSDDANKRKMSNLLGTQRKKISESLAEHYAELGKIHIKEVATSNNYTKSQYIEQLKKQQNKASNWNNMLTQSQENNSKNFDILLQTQYGDKFGTLSAMGREEKTLGELLKNRKALLDKQNDLKKAGKKDSPEYEENLAELHNMKEVLTQVRKDQINLSAQINKALTDELNLLQAETSEIKEQEDIKQNSKQQHKNTKDTTADTSSSKTKKDNESEKKHTKAVQEGTQAKQEQINVTKHAEAEEQKHAKAAEKTASEIQEQTENKKKTTNTGSSSTSKSTTTNAKTKSNAGNVSTNIKIDKSSLSGLAKESTLGDISGKIDKIAGQLSRGIKITGANITIDDTKSNKTQNESNTDVIMNSPDVTVTGQFTADSPLAIDSSASDVQEYLSLLIANRNLPDDYVYSGTNFTYNPRTEKISKAHVKYESSSGEKITDIYGFVKENPSEKNSPKKFDLLYTKVNENAIKYNDSLLNAIKKQNDAASRFNNQLANLRPSLDPNATKTLAGTSVEEELKTSIDNIQTEINKFNSLDENGERTIFSKRELIDQEAKIASMLLEARTFISESRNKIYPPEVFDTKNISSQTKKYESQLDAFIEQVKRAGLYTGEFKYQLDGLQKELKDVEVGEDLREFQTNFAVAKGNFSERKTYDSLYDDLVDSTKRMVKLDWEIQSEKTGINTKKQLEIKLQIERDIYSNILQQLRANNELYNSRQRELKVYEAELEAYREIDEIESRIKDKEIDSKNNSIAKEVNNAQKKFDEFYRSMGDAPSAVSDSMTDKLVEYEQLLSKLKTEQQKLADNPELLDDENYRTSFDDILYKIKKVQKEFVSLQTSEAKVSTISSLDLQLTQFEEGLKRSGHYTDEFKTKITELRQQISGIKTQGDVELFKIDFDDLKENVEKFKTTFSAEADIDTINKLVNQLDKFEQKVIKSGNYTDEFKIKIQQLKQDVNNIKTVDDVDLFKINLDDIDSEFNKNTTYNDLFNKLVKSRARQMELGRDVKYSNGSRLVLEEEKENAKILEEQLRNYDGIYDRQASLAAWAEARAIYEKEVAKSVEKQYSKSVGDIDKSFDKAKSTLDNMIYHQNVGDVQASGLQKYIDDYQEVLTKIDLMQRQIHLHPELSDDKNYINNFNELLRQLGDIESKFKNVRKTSQDFLSNIKDTSDIKFLGDGFDADNLTKLHIEMREFANQVANGKAELIQFDDVNKTANFEIKNGTRQVQELKVAYDSGTQSIGRYITKTKDVMTSSERFIGTIKQGFRHVTQYLASFGGVYEVFAEIRRGLTYVLEIDTALTELKKVTNETDETYNQFLHTMSEVGGVIGATTSELVSSAADWAKLGYSIQEAGELAKNTSMLLNISEFEDIATATEAMVSILQAFNYSASDSLQIVDKLNIVGNNFAISSDGIAEGLQRSAAVLVEAGNDLEQSIAMMAAGNKVIQDPEQVGSALKVLSMRIRGTKTELEEMGESTEGMATNTAKLRDKIMALTQVDGKKGVDILSASGEYRSTYDILVDIADVYDDILEKDNKTASALTELLAGKNRANVLAAILQNPEDLEEAYNIAQDSDGSALAENEKYLDSIQGRIDQFKNALQTMWMDTLDSNMIKSVIQLGTALIGLVDKFGLVKTALIGVATGFMAIKKINPITLFKDFSTQMHNAAVTSEQIKALQSIGVGGTGNTFDATAINAYASILNGLPPKVQAVQMSIAGLNKEQMQEVLIKNNVSDENIQLALTEANVVTAKQNAIVASGKELAAMAKEGAITVSNTAQKWLLAQGEEIVTLEKINNAVSSGKLTQAQGAELITTLSLAAGNVTLATTFKALGASIKAAFMSNPIGMTLMAITTAISLLLPLINNVVKSNKELIEQADELESAYKQETSTIKQNISTLKQLEDEFASLSAGVDEYGNNISLATDDYARYKEIVQQVVGISPSLIAGYDAEGNAIANKNKLLERAIELERMIAQEEAKEFVDKDSRKTIFKAYEANLKEYNKETGLMASDASKAHSEFQDEFVNAVNKHGLDTMIDALNIEGVDSTNYTGTAQTFATTYYKEIANALRVEGNNFGQYFSDGAILDMLNSIQVYDTYKQRTLDNGKNIYGSALTDFLQVVPQSLSSYYELDEEAQLFLSNYINSLDVASIQTKSDLKDMQSDIEDFTRFLVEDEGFRKNAFKASDIVSDTDLSIEEYNKQIQDFWDEINNSNYTSQQKQSLWNVLGWNTDTQEFENDITSAIDHTKALLADGSNEASQEFLDNLSVRDALVIHTHISAEPGTMSVDELKAELAEIKESQGLDINTFDTYSALAESVESYNEVLSQSSEVMVKNVQVSQEFRDSLVALGATEDELNECFYEGNPLVVKNAEALQELLDTSRDNISSNINLAKSQSRLNYYNLVQQLNEACNATGNLTNEQIDNAHSLMNQIDSVQQAIYKYQLLETSLTAANGAFKKFAQAQEIDALNTTGDSYVEMAQTVYDAFYKNGQVGTQAFQVAVESLVPDKVYSSLQSDGDKLQAIYKYFNNNILPSLTLDSDALSIGQSDIDEFVTKGLNSGIFKGSAANGLSIVEGMDLERGAKLMGVTEAHLTAMLAELEKYDYNTSAESFLSQIDDSFDSRIMGATSQIQKLNEEKLALLESGGYDENKERISEINNLLSEQDQKLQTLQSEAVIEYETYADIKGVIESLETIEDKQQEVSRVFSEEQMIELGLDGDETVQEAIDKITAKLLTLEEPTELMVQFAKEGVMDQIDDLIAKIEKDKTVTLDIEYNDETGEYKIDGDSKYFSRDSDTGEWTTTLSGEDAQALVDKLNQFDSLNEFADSGMVTTETLLGDIKATLNSLYEETTGKDAPGEEKEGGSSSKTKPLSESPLSNNPLITADESSNKLQNSNLIKQYKELEKLELEYQSISDKNSTEALAKADQIKKKEQEISQVRIDGYKNAINEIDIIKNKNSGMYVNTNLTEVDEDSKEIAIKAITEYENGGTIKDLFEDLDAIDDKEIRTEIIATFAEQGAFSEILSDLNANEQSIVFDVLTKGEGDLESLNKMIGDIEDKDVQTEVIALVDGALENVNTLNGKLIEIEDTDYKAVINAVTKYENGGSIDDLLRVINSIEDEEVRKEVFVTLTETGTFDDFLKNLEDKDKQIVIDAIVKGEADVNQLNKIIDTLPPEVQSIVRTLVDGALENISLVDGKLQEIDGKNVNTTFTGDSSGLVSETYIANNTVNEVPLYWETAFLGDSSGLVGTANVADNAITGVDTSHNTEFTASIGESFWNKIYEAKNAVISVARQINANLSGGGGVNGTAHAKGTAWAGGTALKGGRWGADKTETALVGELGPEIVVRGNRWFTVGDNGAQFTHIQKGDIIFNHRQTEELLKNGYVTSGSGRGKAHAQGTAHAEGTAYAMWSVSSSGSSSSSSVSKSGSDKSSNKSTSDYSDDFEELFDWFEIKIEEINEDLDLMSAKLENAISAQSRNRILDDMIAINNEQLDTLEKGYNLYNNYANNLLNKIPAAYRTAAKNGKIALEEFAGAADEKTLEAIEKYREWAQKAADLQVQLQEVKKEIEELAKQQFDNIQDRYDIKSSIQDKQNEKLESAINYDEERGYITSDKYYTEMAKNTKQQIDYYTNARKEMQETLDKQVKAGNVKKYSDAWYEMVEQLYDVDLAIDECTLSLEEYQNAINEIHWDNFEELTERLENLSDETSNLIELMGDIEKPVITPEDDKGWSADEVKWSDEGMAQLGLYAQQMEVAEYQAKKYAEAIDELNAQYAEGRYSEAEYLEKLDELKDGQYDAIDSYYEAQDAIVELNEARVDSIKEGIEKEIDAYSELIEKKQEELDAEKDLYDFQKSVMEQSKDISDLERQIAALSGDNSASARAKRKQLEAELAEANAALQETYYERSLEDKQNGLDKELESFQEEKEKEIEQWEKYLEDIETVVADTLSVVQNNAFNIYDILQERAKEYNLTLSDYLLNPWKDGILAVDEYANNFGNAVSSTTDELGKLESGWQDVADSMDAAAEAEINAQNQENSAYTAAEKYVPPEPTPAPQPTSKPSSSSSSGKITVGSRINAGSARIYADSYGGGGGTQYFGHDPIYTVIGENNGYVLVRYHKLSQGATGWFKKTDVKAYAKGTTGVNKDQFAWIDELGEELQLIPGKNGRLEYLKKGTAVVPADLTSNLMAWGEIDPTSMIDQNRPSIKVSPSIANTEMNINISYGDIVHIDEFNGESPEDIAKLVAKQFEKHTKDLNNSLRRFTR